MTHLRAAALTLSRDQIARFDTAIWSMIHGAAPSHHPFGDKLRNYVTVPFRPSSNRTQHSRLFSGSEKVVDAPSQIGLPEWLGQPRHVSWHVLAR